MNWFDFFNFFSPAHNEKKRADTALYRRSERPKNGADAQPCLSDVYKNSTRAKRRQADVPLCGRSMVEMLGVLAIIGVLSVGAMSGYSKAMFKYKLNKMSEQYNQIISAMIAYARQFKIDSPDADDNGSYAITAMYNKLGLIPEEMKLPTTDDTLVDVFSNEVWIAYETTGDTLYTMLQIDKSDQNLSICRQFFLIAKEFHEDIYVASSLSDWGNENSLVGSAYGDKYCRAWNKCLKDLTLNDIDSMCAEHIDKNASHLKLRVK